MKWLLLPLSIVWGFIVYGQRNNPPSLPITIVCNTPLILLGSLKSPDVIEDLWRILPLGTNPKITGFIVSTNKAEDIRPLPLLAQSYPIKQLMYPEGSTSKTHGIVSTYADATQKIPPGCWQAGDQQLLVTRTSVTAQSCLNPLPLSMLPSCQSNS